METDPLEQVAAYVVGFGASSRRVRELVVALTEDTWTLDALIATSALPRRAVEGLLENLDGDLHGTPRGMTIRPDRVPPYRERFAAGRREHRLPDPLTGRVATVPDVLAEMERLVDAAPAPLPSLDHVPATPETAVRRALWLDATYDLDGARLLCVGDHDLTALAACAVNPHLTVTVVDVDERLLAYIDEHARRRGWNVRCLYADLRHRLPPEAAESADLVFTDPPYTPEGAALFVARGLEGLRDREYGRVLLAYGFGSGHPTLGLKVQRAVQRLDTVFEAILPDFNTYRGAQAIGAASDLYVCRATAGTWRKLDRPAATGAGNVYTRGRHALEAGDTTLPGDVAEHVLRQAAGPDELPVALLAGDGWPDAQGTRRTPLAELLAHGVPESVRRQRPTAVAADLSADPGSWLLRTLLTVGAERAALLVPNSHPDVADEAAQHALAENVRVKYDLRLYRSQPGPAYAVVIAERVDPVRLSPADAALGHILDRAHGTVANAWREGLVSARRKATGGHGQPLSKNAAREMVRRAARDPHDLRARLIDLPRHRISELAADVSASTGELPAAAG